MQYLAPYAGAAMGEYFPDHTHVPGKVENREEAIAQIAELL